MFQERHFYWNKRENNLKFIEQLPCARYYSNCIHNPLTFVTTLQNRHYILILCTKKLRLREGTNLPKITMLLNSRLEFQPMPT